MKHLIIILFSLISISSYSQSNLDHKKLNKEGIGFGCYSAASITKPVWNMITLFGEKNLDKIRKTLNSKLPADQFLGVFVLEKIE